MANYYFNVETRVLDADTGAAATAAVTAARLSKDGYYNGTEVKSLTVGGTLSAWIGTTRHLHASATIADGYSFAGFTFTCSAVGSLYRTQQFSANPMGALQYANYTSYSANTSAAKALAVVLTISVRRTVQTVTVTFDPNGGSVSTPSKSVTVGQAYGTLPTPTRSGGYSFDGWFTAASGGTRVTASSTVQNASAHTLYAHWSDPVPITVTVTLDPNGGSVSTPSKSVTVGQAYGTLPTPTRTGFVCTGWYTASAGGSVVTASTTVKNASNHTLYAQWTLSGSHLRYDTDTVGILLYNPPRFLFADRISTAVVGLPADAAPCPSPDFLQCTLCRSEATGSTYDNATIVLFLTSSPSGYPINATGSIGDSAVSVSGEPDDHAAELGFWRGIDYRPDRVVLAFDETALRNAGYTAYGWLWGTRPKEDGESRGYLNGITNLRLQAGSSLDVPKDWLKGTDWSFAVLCIPLVRRISIVVTFNPCGGSLASGTYFKRVRAGETYGTLPTPVRTGHSFAGWFTQESGGDPVTESTKLTVLANHTLYAHWSALPVTATVFFRPNGGTTPTDAKTVTVGKPYGTLPTSTRDGYSFAGWFTASAGGVEITAATTVATVRTHKLYAHWSRDTVTVYFDGNGGTVETASVSIKVGYTYDEFPSCTRDGYIFDGWYTAATGGMKVDIDTVVTTSHTIYAHWTEPPTEGGSANLFR